MSTATATPPTTSNALTALHDENAMLKKKLAEMEAKPSASSAKSYDETEPILAENPGRFVIFPIKHPDVWKMVRPAAHCAWTLSAINVLPTHPTALATRCSE